MPAADESGMAPVNDIQMYYAVFNKGGPDPVLLIHGGLSNSDYWGDQVPALMKDHEVIVADSRGHGRSTRSGQPFGYDLMSSDYLALLDYLHIDKVKLAGWSDGGIIGLDIAINHPDRLVKLWAFGANYTVDGVYADVAEKPVFAAFIERAGEEYARLSPTPNDYEGFVNAISDMWFSQPAFTAAQLGSIPVPTMIADGEFDEGIKPEHTREMASLIPGASLLIMPGVSHFAALQDPAAYNAALIGFLDGE
jgi:pimeloyl-ACP methyl ester carboxylesterase